MAMYFNTSQQLLKKVNQVMFLLSSFCFFDKVFKRYHSLN